MRWLIVALLSLSVVIAGALVAGAHLVVFRWEIVPAPGGSVVRLDRWTGDAVLCARLPYAVASTGEPTGAGDMLDCDAADVAKKFGAYRERAKKNEEKSAADRSKEAEDVIACIVATGKSHARCALDLLSEKRR